MFVQQTLFAFREYNNTLLQCFVTTRLVETSNPVKLVLYYCNNKSMDRVNEMHVQLTVLLLEVSLIIYLEEVVVAHSSFLTEILYGFT